MGFWLCMNPLKTHNFKPLISISDHFDTLPWPISRKTTRSPPPQSKNPTSESPSRPRAQKPSTRRALKSAREQRPSTAEATTVWSRSRDHDQCQPGEWGSPPEKHRVVKVPKPGTDTKCESTSESSSSSAARAKSWTSPRSNSSQVCTLSWPSQNNNSFEIVRFWLNVDELTNFDEFLMEWCSRCKFVK